jgi:outer membrane receptor protein involved in Fe transport
MLRLTRISLCAMVLAVAAAPVFSGVAIAQAQTGSIRLDVRDPSGAGMEASGSAQNLGTGVVVPFQTKADGSVTVPNLPLGRYRLTVSREGFETQSLTVELSSPSPVSRTVTLPIGAAAAQVDVVAVTPLPGSDLDVRDIPAPIQTATAQDIQNSTALDLSDFLNRRLSGVNINENQGNPFQADVNYRGYTASPLLGTPQGLSVYMDGVRLNQPFGDVVNWDLIPRIAIDDIGLVPGSNPLFGLNTLGGALSIETKDGRSHRGTSVEVTGGSFGRRAGEFESGGLTAKGFHWYVAGNWFHEDGWRVASPSDVRQIFAKAGWQGAASSVTLTSGYADNVLIGNGLQEQRFLARDYASGYTLGDLTSNRSPFVNAIVRHAAGAWTVSANAYLRYLRTSTVNPNLNNNSLDEAVYQPTPADQAALSAAGYTGFPTSGANASNTPFPYWRCIAQALQLSEPSEKCTGVIVNGLTEQYNYGATGQATWTTTQHGRSNRLTAGAGWDRSALTFQQSMQFAYVNPDYTLTGVNAFGDGSTNQNGEPVDTRVNLHGVPQTVSVYATDTLSIGGQWSLTASGRYNRTTITNTDRLNPGGGPGSLDAGDVFQRFNPAAGVTFSPHPNVTTYASYSEGSRAPTTIELGCADPNNPCSLPNALAGDPPLDQVVTRTFEVGVRGATRPAHLSWSAGWFWTRNHDDILFVSSTQTGNGYFKNFGDTQRAGLEARVTSRIGRVTLGANYTFLSATYQSTETIDGSSNSTNDAAQGGTPGMDGVITIQPGDRIPLIPHHLGKAFADLQLTNRISVNIGLLSASSAYARGNENNEHEPDGVYYLGPGTSPAYGVVNVGARYQVARWAQVFGQINNLFDHHYYTAAQLGPTGFTDQGTFIARPFPAANGNFPVVHATFYAPGAPIGAWGGLRVTF